MRLISLLLVTFIFTGTPVRAQDMFVGYDSFCGVRVVVGNTDRQALALVDNAGPYIYVDRGVMANWTASRLFTLAHECGHHRLGHTTPHGLIHRTTRFGTRNQELRADCWAAEALTELGLEFDIDRAIRDHANRGHFSAGGYPSGIERAKYIQQCRDQEEDDYEDEVFCENIVYDCSHRAHPKGDLHPCSHYPIAQHFDGDIVPCNHPCQTPWGGGPCHPNGHLIPCQHPVRPHEADVTACDHPAHPRGHTEQVCY